MKKITISTLLHLFLFCSLFFSWFPNAKPQDIEDDFSYIEGSSNGPENWGKIKPEYATCGNGKEQSPVVVSFDVTEMVSTLGPLKRSYNATDAILMNRGYDIVLGWTRDAGSLVINETVYYLRQIHWHAPAEHIMFGTRSFELEAHLVHESEDQKIAVIAVLHRLGSPDPFLTKLEHDIKQINTKYSVVNVGVVDPRIISIEDNIYYRYMGSLTTPPCTEGVVWTISIEFGTVSQSQIDLLKGAVDNSATNNARPLQPINSRTILFNIPTSAAGSHAIL